MSSRDPFLEFARSARFASPTTVPETKERAHSKFSASAAERWFKCQGSVKLSEGLPDKSSPWAAEGTRAHKVLEKLMELAISAGDKQVLPIARERDVPPEMHRHGTDAANFMLRLFHQTPGAELMVETRIYLAFIHPEMFGTFDGAVVDHFGTLHVFDYKYGAGHAVAPTGNLQMIFYAIGVAHRFGWNFKRARLWIIQPRIKGYDGPVYWEISITELRRWVGVFQAAVDRVIAEPDRLAEGGWCHWCKAKTICPLKRAAKLDRAQQVFSSPVKNGIENWSGEE